MDLFCGTGGFSKGFEKTGLFRVIHGVDSLATSVDTFRLNHPHALGVNGDIRGVDKSALAERLELRPGDVNVIIGGPPCQGFSSIRPHRSTNDDDPRNDLFSEFASYVAQFRPQVLVFENVVGLATHKGGSTLDAIQSRFDALGYDTDWRVLNAAHFGVPQKRERLIMLGVERGGSITWPRPQHHDGQLRTIGYHDSRRMVRATQGSLWDSEALPPPVTVAEGIDDLPAIESGGRAVAYDRPPRTNYQVARRSNCEELTLHSSTRHTPRMLEIIRHSGSSKSAVPEHLISSGFSSSYSRLEAHEPSVTLTVNFVHPASNRCIHPTLDRALTPREGARIQSFDDTFRFAGNRTAIVKQIGNAVPPLLGTAVAQAVAWSLGSINDPAKAGRVAK